MAVRRLLELLINPQPVNVLAIVRWPDGSGAANQEAGVLARRLAWELRTALPGVLIEQHYSSAHLRVAGPDFNISHPRSKTLQVRGMFCELPDQHYSAAFVEVGRNLTLREEDWIEAKLKPALIPGGLGVKATERL